MGLCGDVLVYRCVLLSVCIVVGLCCCQCVVGVCCCQYFVAGMYYIIYIVSMCFECVSLVCIIVDMCCNHGRTVSGTPVLVCGRVLSVCLVVSVSCMCALSVCIVGVYSCQHVSMLVCYCWCVLSVLLTV